MNVGSGASQTPGGLVRIFPEYPPKPGPRISETIRAHGTLATDRPRESAATDRLNRASFADRLALALKSLESPKGTVVAIDGPWGSGKTTILNFLGEALEAGDSHDNVVVRFNPWWFAGRSELAGSLLHEISASLGGSRSLRKIGRKYLAGIASAAQVFPSAGVGASARKIESWAKSTPPISEAKRKFDAALSKSGKRLFVFVDDVDRLEPREIGDLFSAIKALADFPNAVYVIALDSVQVAEHLSKETNMDGAAYLEKLVQVSFPVPLPSRDGLDTLLLEGLNEVIGEPESDLFDQDEWNDQFSRGLSLLVRTPRDVVRLTNALRITYESVRNEVNVGTDPLSVTPSTASSHLAAISG